MGCAVNRSLLNESLPGNKPNTSIDTVTNIAISNFFMKWNQNDLIYGSEITEWVDQQHTHVSTDDIYIPIKGTVLKGTEMRDIYKLALEVFADPIKTWIYIISILIIGYHMWYGWSKTIMNNYNKMGLTKEYKKIATHFGHVVVVLVTVGFLSSPIYIHYFLLGQVEQ